MIKKISFGIGTLIILFGLGGYFLFLNLDHIVKSTVEKYGTAATQAKVSLDTVALQLTSGEGKLTGLSIGNPRGFSTPQAFYLGSIEVKVDTGTIHGTGPIIISQMVIDKPQVTYELLNSGTSNLQAIQENTQSYASSFQGKKTDSQADAASTATANPTKEQPGRKIIISDLVIRDGQIAISQELLKGKQLSAPLPEIHLTNIGKATGGATAAQVADQILTAMTNSAAQASVVELAKEKINGLIQAVPTGAIGGAAKDTIGNSIKGILGN